MRDDVRKAFAVATVLGLACWAGVADAQSRKVVGAPKEVPAAAPAETATTEQPVEETIAGGDCKDVAFTIRNRTGAPVALISVDHATERRWTRGPILSTVVADGEDYVWTGTFPEIGLKATRFRVNTREVLDTVTARYGGLAGREIRTEACKTGETYVIAFPEGAE